jgi:hypothetical protein
LADAVVEAKQRIEMGIPLDEAPHANSHEEALQFIWDAWNQDTLKRENKLQ